MRVVLRLGLKVQRDDAKFIAIRPAPHLPEGGCSSDVQNANWVREVLSNPRTTPVVVSGVDSRGNRHFSNLKTGARGSLTSIVLSINNAWNIGWQRPKWNSGTMKTVFHDYVVSKETQIKCHAAGPVNVDPTMYKCSVSPPNWNTGKRLRQASDDPKGLTNAVCEPDLRL